MTHLRPLSPALAKRAREELGEVDSRVAEDLQALRLWIELQHHIKARTDDQLLIAFLRGCKFSLEQAKKKLEFFYSSREAVPEIYKNRFINDNNLELYKSGIFLRLPKPLVEAGPRILFLRYGKYDTNKYKMADVMRLHSILAEIELREDDNKNVAGFIEIMDFTGITINYILQFDAALTKKLAVLGDKAWPTQVVGFHIINAPRTAERVLNLIKTILTGEAKERFHVHANLESLYKFVPREYLPIDYGGDNGSVSEILETGLKKCMAYKSYFEEDVQYGTKENYRKSQAQKNIKSNGFGLEGSFRKLDID